MTKVALFTAVTPRTSAVSERITEAVSTLCRSLRDGRLLNKDACIDVSLNPPMSCMMQGVCGQCVQRLSDPVTGEERLIFTCGDQFQSAKSVDWTFLKTRLGRKTLQERLQV